MPRFVADVGVGVEESVEGGMIRAMPVPRRVADVGVGVKEILRRFDDDVGVGVEDNVVKVAEVEFANEAVAAIFLFPDASVKEDIIFRHCPMDGTDFICQQIKSSHRARAGRGRAYYRMQHG